MIIAISIMAIGMLVEFYNITTWNLAWVDAVAMASVSMSLGAATMIWLDIKQKVSNLESDMHKLSKKLSKIQKGIKEFENE